MADANSIEGIPVSTLYAYTIVIIFATVLVTIVLGGLAYLVLRCLKKRRVAPEYYEKDPPEYDKQNFDAAEPQLVQVQPILTVSEVVSSVKQALEVLGQTITPKRWSNVQVEEKPASEI